ncbi:Presenilins-associated rhomboid-like protein, mitochondrial [Sphaceloma murrayae]|uniref:Presenilins-associated rhomboid-like protein, mitochondrial n=1 Tax=Sphaceloma murrayae TaxID=2082308 RepID=A0A2K1QXL8_9PEZI|nr:Presenilins-associated rhomboid-like protein, mitochondrial [Sphaceloma murrayae]
MNWRRQSGALIDKQIDFPEEFGISRTQAFEALLYLRKAYPDFDEQAAGVAWAEDQINEVSQEYVARAEKLGLYRRATNDDQNDEQAPATDDVYGESQLVRMRRSNEARAQSEEEARLEREKAEEAARIAKLQTEKTSSSDAGRKIPGQDTSDHLGVGASSTATLARPVERKAWVKYYEDRATLIKDKAPPPISKLRRLLPSFLVTLLVLGGCYILHTAYVPPPTSARYFPDLTPGTATISLLAGTMLVVLLAYRIPPLWRIMNTYFISVPAAPTAASTFLSTFTHQQFNHLFFNVILLYAFGQYLHEDVGRGTFLAIFLACGTVANYAALTSYVLRNKWNMYAFGSSTGVYGVIAATCLLRADHDIEVFGVRIPATGLTMLLVFTALEIALLLRGGGAARGISFEAHFSGLLAGAACAGGVRWEVEREKRRLALGTNLGGGEPLMVQTDARTDRQ